MLFICSTSAGVRVPSIAATFAFSSTIARVSMPANAICANGWARTKRIAISAVLLMSFLTIFLITPEGAPNLPPPTGPIITVPIPFSWAYFMPFSFDLSNKLYWIRTEEK
jgi:hypothetical protein